MLKRCFLVVLAGCAFSNLIEAPHRRMSFGSIDDKGVVSDGLRRLESTRKRDHENMKRYILEHGPRIKSDFALEKETALAARELEVRLNEFVTSAGVQGLLDQRFSLEGRDAILGWIETISTKLEAFGGILKNCDSHTLEFEFKDIPGYRILSSVAPWPLGAYDAKEGSRLGFNCNFYCTPGCEYSEYAFPLQLVSRVLYADEINTYVAARRITNVRAAQHYLFNFPWAVDAHLNDADIFVVVENVSCRLAGSSPFDSCSDEIHTEGLSLLQRESKSFSGDEAEARRQLLALADTESDTSLLANLVRVVQFSGIWNFNPSKNNPRFVLEGGVYKAIFCNIERPSVGKAAFFFHACDGARTDRAGVPGERDDEEIVSHANEGLGKLVKMLKVSPDTGAPAAGAGRE